MQRWPTSVWMAYAKSTGVDARRQGDDLALGREDVDLVLLEVELQGLEELDGVGGLLLHVDDALEPGHLRRVEASSLDCSL